MRKFINRPENVVEEMLQRLAVLSHGMARLSGQKVMIRAEVDRIRDQQVEIISGGGSGHEPAHAGYIHDGMLSAAVAGEVFTSPDTDSILAAIKAVAGKHGALLVVKNYTGDRLNFGLAAEMARSEGIRGPVSFLVGSIFACTAEPNSSAQNPKPRGGSALLLREAAMLF